MDFTQVKKCISGMAWRIGRLEIKEAIKIEVCLEHWFWSHIEDEFDYEEQIEYDRLRKLLDILEHQTFAFNKPEEYNANRCLESGY